MNFSRCESRFRFRSWLNLVFFAVALFCCSKSAASGVLCPMLARSAALPHFPPNAGRSASDAGLNYRPAHRQTAELWICLRARTCTTISACRVPVWNRNQLLLNSSSASGAFYQQDRGSSQEAAIFGVLRLFRRRCSRVRPYLAGGAGWLHFSSTAERLAGSGGATAPPPAEFSWTGPVWRTHVRDRPAPDSQTRVPL